MGNWLFKKVKGGSGAGTLGIDILGYKALG